MVSAQSHFEDVCRLVGHDLPAKLDPNGAFFTYEKGVEKSTGGQGFADVWYDGHFGFEYKGKGKYSDLSGAYQQLLQYRERLHNPPLLVVCDIEFWEIHTNFAGTEKRVYKFTNEEIATQKVQNYLHSLFFEPRKLHPDRNTEQVTAEAAEGFKLLADNMRDFEADPERIAHFLTKIVFCLFAEDIGLLPTFPHSERGIFSEIIETTVANPENFVKDMHNLFEAMAQGGRAYLQDIPYFNGNLFDDLQVERPTTTALGRLRDAARLNWQSVEPAIFGTLFERSLDPAKRAQLGAHYTSPDDIMLIVEPVLMQPLRREWDKIQTKAQPFRQQYETADNKRDAHDFKQTLLALRDDMLKQLRTVTVLDPACGSGNFLYMSLRALLDLEKEVINAPLFVDLDDQPAPQVHPQQLFGMEKDPIAHSLASIVVWIGYIQWRFENGYWYTPADQPYLTRLQDNIRCMDAILAFDADGKPVEPAWQAVDVIVGNPPFLGDKKMRSELGDEYVDNLRKLYDGQIPGQSDLVCYWFERARKSLAKNSIQRAGLLSTNSIRQGSNRYVLDEIAKIGELFFAESDREWILDGASVRVSMIGFDSGKEINKFLDGISVASIHPDLTSGINVTQASKLLENENICFLGMMKAGPFDIDDELAQKMLNAKNSTGKSNTDVVKKRMGGQDITRRARDIWIIDFGTNLTEQEASEYELPFEYIVNNVKPIRESNRRNKLKKYWWLYGEPRAGLREATKHLSRFLVTPEVSKHRVFTWVNQEIIPDHKLHVFAREDDYILGVLHSYIHETWTLATCSWLGVGNDPSYSSSKTFDTFPLPYVPSEEPTSAPEYQAIAEAARQLHAERDAWLNPPADVGPRDVGAREKWLKERTLTNLYNALTQFRGTATKKVKIKKAAGDFAPRLHVLHQALDAAVCAAYGWDVAILEDEEAILGRLLALNLARAE